MVPGPTKRQDLSTLDGVERAITNERIENSKRWSAAHDYDHSTIEWAGIVSKYLGRAIDAKTADEAQHALIQAGGVIMAAVQAIELWRYGGNAAEALNNLHEKVRALSTGPLPSDEALPPADE